jgi:hypothetical protein
VARSVADDLGYAALTDVARALEGVTEDYRIIGGHMVTMLAARWQLSAELYREVELVIVADGTRSAISMRSSTEKRNLMRVVRRWRGADLRDSRPARTGLPAARPRVGAHYSQQ